MDHGKDKDDTRIQIRKATKSAAWVGQVPWVYTLHSYLQPLVGILLALAARNGTIRQWASHQVMKRKPHGQDHQDILTELIKVHEGHSESFDTDAITSMAATNIFAGSETTATAMRAIVYYVLKDDKVRETLVKEIDETFKAEKLPTTNSFKRDTRILCNIFRR